MRSLGALVRLAGIGVAVFVYPVDRGGSLDELRRAATPPDVQLPPSRVTPVVRLSAFSPSIALTTPPAAALTPVTTEAPSGWQTTIAVAAPAPTQAVLPKTLSPTDPDARYKLVLEIQQQLKRVGCYWGRMDGSWGLATKDAMKEFTDRVNAALPLDEPDYVQLTLIQSHGEKTCGTCPTGQSLSASGHCAGLPITAQATAQKEVLPWKTTSAPNAPGGQPLFTPMPTTVVSTEPLPGRMAIGASVTTSVDSQHSEAPVLPGGAATPPGTTTAVLDPNVAVVKPSATAAPQTDRHARPESGYHRTGPGTPRYNLLLSLGGVY
jgi:hypothetical protein